MSARRLRGRTIAAAGAAVELMDEVPRFAARLYTVAEYEDDSARLGRLPVRTLVVHGTATTPFHRAINAALLVS